MKCDHCGHEWIAISPVGAQELECPQCGEMTSIYSDIAVEYTTVTLRFMYLEGGRPESGVVVLGAWTNGDEFHITPSVWDSNRQRWLDHGGSFALDTDYWLYAWAEWPDAPPQ